MQCLQNVAVTIFILCTVLQTVPCIPTLQYAGCFSLSFSLQNNYHVHVPFANLEKCVSYCSQKSTRYVGIETSDNFCYCGDDIAEQSEKRNDTFCNVVCPDNSTYTCGGDWLLSAYDLKPTFTSISGGFNNLSFLVAMSNNVRAYISSDLDNYRTVVKTTDFAHVVDYHFDKKLLFMHTEKSIFKATLEQSLGGNYKKTLVKKVTKCEGFAVDWVKDRVIYADCGSSINSIMSMDLNGGMAYTVLSDPRLNGSINRMEVDPYKGRIFWISDGVIEACDETSTNFQTNMSSPGVTVRSLTLDLGARRVYYVGASNQSTSLYSMDYEGKDTLQHLTAQQLRSVYGMGLFSGELFWVNYANYKDILYKTSLQQSASNIQLLTIVDKAVWHMRVMHPDLQKRPQVDPCVELGCSYICERSNLASPTCKCPEGQELSAHDEATCITTESSNTDYEHENNLHFTSSQGYAVEKRGSLSVVTIMGVMLVVLILGSAVVAVYLKDRYWSQVRPKLFSIRVPYSRTEDSNDASPSYTATEDNVVLI